MPRFPRPFCEYFYDETWKANIWLMWPAGPADLKELTNELDGLSIGTGWHGHWMVGRHRKTGAEVNVIALQEFDWSPNSIATLAHECFHAVEWILLERVKHHQKHTSEAYAYLLESLVKRCLEAIQERERRTRRKGAKLPPRAKPLGKPLRTRKAGATT